MSLVQTARKRKQNVLTRLMELVGRPEAIYATYTLQGGLGSYVKYYVSNAAAETPLATLALVTGCRYRVEEWFGEGKSYLGMAQYEARAWSSWHHHMSL